MGNIKCIGFTATPTDKYPPFNKLLTNYSIYDGVKDGVILPPKIVWFKSEDIIQQVDILSLYDKLKEKLYYKKVIVWCGMIELCYEMAEMWNDYFIKSNKKYQYVLILLVLKMIHKMINKTTYKRINL